METHMACAYCRSTPVNPCPVCTVAPDRGQVLRSKRGPAPRPVVKRAAPAAVSAPVPAPAPAQAYRKGPFILGCADCGKQYESAYVREVCDPCLEATPTDPAVAVVPAPTRNPEPARIAVAIRLAMNGGQIGLALAGMAKMADPAKLKLRLAILEQVDANAAKRGYLTDRDVTLRDSMLGAMSREWQAMHGYDPRDPPGAVRVDLPWEHRAVGVVPLTQEVKALPAPTGPLMSGDWADLAERVKRGQLSAEDAKQIGAIWIRQTAQA